MVPVPLTSTRPYRGIHPADRQARRRARLLEAGLDILGSGPGPDALTVRGVCRQAGLAARYFYESFSDKDEFIGAVFDRVIAHLAATTQAAVASAPPGEQNRAAMANIVRTIVADPRLGRLVFSTDLADALLVRKRAESEALFALLSGQHVGKAFDLSENDRIKATAHFVVGGVAQTLSAWLEGAVSLTAEELVDQLAKLLNQLRDPALYRADD
jgi:AcrR family transcriptional regulator